MGIMDEYIELMKGPVQTYRRAFREFQKTPSSILAREAVYSARDNLQPVLYLTT